MTERKSAIRIANDLIECCKDGENGFRAAAEEASVARLKDLFVANAKQMGRFRKELQEEVINMGGVAPTHGTLKGTIHRGWMEARSLVNMHKPELVLVECERGQADTLDHYQKALESPLPANLKKTIENQYVEILVARNHIHSLEMGPKARESEKPYNPLSTE